MNAPPMIENYEQKVLSWLKGKVMDGQGVLKRERGYMEYENSKKFVNGEQYPLRSRAISRITDNRLRKIVLETIGALTDVRPIWNYDTYNYQYKGQAEVLSKLARSWWKNNQVDRRLQSILTYAMCGGSAYGYLRWNPDILGGGDFDLVPLSPMDVIPIEPVYSDSIQDWRGVIIRMNLPTESIKAMYPLKSHIIGRTKGSWVAPMTREGGSLYTVMSAAWASLTRGYEGKQQEPTGTTDLFFVYIKDETLNTGTGTVKMGRPDSNWSYEVPPLGTTKPDGSIVNDADAKLYPRGRLLVATMDCVCEDGPNPYWHGMFPLVRFTLEPLPWSLLGASIIGDLIPLQNALNESLRGLEDGMAQWIRRGVVADRQSISKTTLEAIDTRKAGLRAYLNNNAAGQGFQVIDGPQFPAWYMEFVQFLQNEMDTVSGTRGLRELAQLKQMPSADTMQKYMEALSPVLRTRARVLEIALGELAEMLKVGFFQYYDQQRRFEIVGPDGVTVEDFDYDPNSMVPGPQPGPVDPATGQPGPPDPMDTRERRAEKHHRNFKFNVAPNSFLNVSHSEQKLLILQMFRNNIMDPWTLWQSMDLPNVGSPPAERLEERIIAARQMGLLQGPTPELVQLQIELQKAQLMMQLQQIQGMQMGGMAGGPPGQGGPPGGGGATAAPSKPEGRPPSGQEAPTMVQRNDEAGPRTVVKESK